MNLIIKNKIQKLPQNPGVYVFYGEDKNILYVGKATNLRSRVQSYFRGGESERLIGIFINQVVDIKTIETESVLEALILESNLIKKYQPKYNAMGKDDKSFSYFVITQEEWPRVVIMRKTELENPKSKITNSKQIPNSSAAADKIQNSRIYGPYTSKKQLEIALKIIRKIFPFHSGKQKTEKGCLDFQIGLCPGPYAEEISRKDYQKNILGIKMILEGKKKNLVRKLEKEMKALAKKHEFEKAGEMRNKIFALKHIRDVALIMSEGSTFGAPKVEPSRELRIEAYDISNISGQHAVGSMAVFKNGEPDKSQYRKFKIKTVQGSDDVGMMREVLLRRFNNDWPQPDLVLLDGGQGHANMVGKILSELNLEITAVSVAKGKTRKNLNFQFPISNKFSMTKFSNEIKDLLKDKNLIKRIMDEAHRFAIGYHRNLRKKIFCGIKK